MHNIALYSNEVNENSNEDGVGAINLHSKVSGKMGQPNPSSRDLGNPLGVRFNWHLSSLDLNPRNFAISEKRITEALAR